MPKITVSERCGNAPKQTFIKEFNIAFAESDIDTITERVTDDIVWDVVGAYIIRGKTDFVSALHKMNSADVAELIIESIITHGAEASASGEIVMKNGERYAFCDVYEFKGAKGTHIKSMKSFNIPLIVNEQD